MIFPEIRSRAYFGFFFCKNDGKKAEKAKRFLQKPIGIYNYICYNNREYGQNRLSEADYEFLGRTLGSYLQLLYAVCSTADYEYGSARYYRRASFGARFV
jgi:hypothetical protein